MWRKSRWLGYKPPAAPGAWRLRFAGLALGIIGALALMIYLPEISRSLARARGLLVPIILILAIVLTTGTFGGSAPQLHRLPLQLAIMVVIWLALFAISKLIIPRWVLPCVGAVLAIGCVIAMANRFVSALVFVPVIITASFLFGSAIVGRIAAQKGSRRDRNLAFAIFAGYVIGQWIPRFV